jgi:hypothetical protein
VWLAVTESRAGAGLRPTLAALSAGLRMSAGRAGHEGGVNMCGCRVSVGDRGPSVPGPGLLGVERLSRFWESRDVGEAGEAGGSFGRVKGGFASVAGGVRVAGGWAGPCVLI